MSRKYRQLMYAQGSKIAAYIKAGIAKKFTCENQGNSYFTKVNSL